MAVGLVQSNAAQTSVNSPASIAPAYGSGTTAGNFLLLTVSVTGSSPTVSTPAGWTLVMAQNSATESLTVFAYPNNPGAITTVTITLNNATNGGAVATLFEISGFGLSLVQDLSSGFSFTGTTYTNNLRPPLFAQELFLITMAFVATASVSSTANDYFFSANVGGGSSTVATTNVSQVNYWGISGTSNPIKNKVVLSASVTGTYIVLSFVGYISSDISYDNVSGNAGQYVGTFNQGMIGG